jgi:hypothetical protein
MSSAWYIDLPAGGHKLEVLYVVTREPDPSSIERVTTTGQEPGNANTPSPPTRHRPAFCIQGPVDIHPPRSWLDRSSRGVFIQRDSLHQTQIDRHTIVDVVRARPDRVSAGPHGELCRRAARALDERVYHLDDIAGACRLDDAGRRELRADGPVRRSAVGVVRRVGVQNVSEAGLFQSLTLGGMLVVVL